jgi:hypothetical protein
MQRRFFFIFGNGILEMLDGFIYFPLFQFELSEEKRIVREGVGGCPFGRYTGDRLRWRGTGSGRFRPLQARTGHEKEGRKKKKKPEQDTRFHNRFITLFIHTVNEGPFLKGGLNIRGGFGLFLKTVKGPRVHL